MSETPTLTQKAFELATRLAKQRQQSIDTVVEQSLQKMLAQDSDRTTNADFVDQFVAYWVQKTQAEPRYEASDEPSALVDTQLYDESGLPR